MRPERATPKRSASWFDAIRSGFPNWLAAHLLRDGAEAEDVTQDTFVRAYGALDRLDGRSEPFTWMYRIAVNLSLNAIRSRKTGRKATTPDDPRIEGLLADQKSVEA